jgi:hypothetical protein
MSNRNFDNRVIIQRLQNQNYARNLYKNNTNGSSLINNPQNTDGSSSRYASFVVGAQTEYFRNLGGTGTISQGGIVNVPSYPTPNNPIPPINIITFTVVGTTTWTAPADLIVQYLIVGGGGGSGGKSSFAPGGSSGGGGGGAVVLGSVSVTKNTVYTIVIGDGGVGGNSGTPPANGSAGGNSSFFSITANGGGGGISNPNSPNNGNGGTTGSGNTGGGGGACSGGNGGGGGGAGGAGASGTSGGTGGVGVSSLISGTLTVYGAGGSGGIIFPPSTPKPGVANTGNGASGGSSGIGFSGAKGGSGIVILQY